MNTYQIFVAISSIKNSDKREKKDRTITLDIAEDTTIADAKAMVQAKVGPPPHTQKLGYMGQRELGHETNNLEQEKTLILSLTTERLPGGTKRGATGEAKESKVEGARGQTRRSRWLTPRSTQRSL